jgi:ribA/ribD-fused uncharacterized protein
MFLRERQTAINIRRAKNAFAAKSHGDSLNNHQRIDEWNKIEEPIMKELLMEKLRICKAFRDKLIKTDTANILHSVKDPKWGIGIATMDVCHPIQSFKGNNLFGTILMIVRDSLLSSNSQSHTSDKETLSKPSVPNSNHQPQVSGAINMPLQKSVSVQSNDNGLKRKQVELIGSSLLNGIDVNRLCHNVDSRKSVAHTIDEAKSMLHATTDSDLIIYQLCTNDVKSQCVEQVISNMKDLISSTHSRLPRAKIAIALPPMQKGEINMKLKAINALLELEYKDSAVLLCPNYNITPDYLNQDGVHLNKAGTKMLANNIRQTIGEVFNIQFKPHGHHMNSNNLNRGSQYHY